MKKTTEMISKADHYACADPGAYPGSVIVDIQTTGRFWRNSYITALDLLKAGPDSMAWLHTHFDSSSEPDEYEILESLPEEIGARTALFTFNGRTFDIPYLSRKLQAYGLPNPFAGLQHTDLMVRYKPLTTLLGIPSYRLSDYVSFFDPDEVLFRNEASSLLSLLTLDAYMALYEGRWTLSKAWCEADFLFFELCLPKPVPKAVSCRDGVIHTHFEGNTARIASPIMHGHLHLYYPDYKNYDYLPLEGHALHKSLSRFVESTRREPAQRETAFGLIPFDDDLIKNERRLTQYLTSLITYLAYPFRDSL